MTQAPVTAYRAVCAPDYRPAEDTPLDAQLERAADTCDYLTVEATHHHLAWTATDGAPMPAPQLEHYRI